MSKRSAAELEAEQDRLREQLEGIRRDLEASSYFYASADAVTPEPGDRGLPAIGDSPDHCYRMVRDFHELDCKERLNMASYVNVAFEPQELKVASLGMKINLADQTVYPQSYKMHDLVLNMVANLWNCPRPPDFERCGTYAGAGTVGSTEACLLAGLCLKLRWRKWYAKRKNLSEDEVRAVYPNLVLSTCFHACWEKFFRYMDVEPKLLLPSKNTSTLTADAVKEMVDDKTIGVMCALGNQYTGQYDPVWEVDAMLQELNKERGWEVGIHVDAASGGFVAPFQDGLPPWDFRLPTVLSIAGSGHKFGESVCGTGWVVWRQREGLSESVAISVGYLGGSSDSYTLNFSRPASGVYVQYYKFHRLGLRGYRQLTDNRMANAKCLRDAMKAMRHKDGRHKFVFLDGGDQHCLPVVTACVNPDLGLPYDAIDLQHHMLRYHWYVSAYRMVFHDPRDSQSKPLFSDAPAEQTMLRVVIKSNVTRPMIGNLITALRECLTDLDKLHPEARVVHDQKRAKTADKHQAC